MALQSISQDYYEAAELDGATGRQSFRAHHVPLLKPILVPAILLGMFLTFNNILVPFFINAAGPGPRVTSWSRRSTGRPSSTAATASRPRSRSSIFAILMVFTIFYVRKTNVLKGAYES